MTSQDSTYQQDDEIDLRDLALMLVDGWYWIIGTLIVILLAAGAYLLVTTPTYETRFRAVPASGSAFAGFNLLEGFDIEPADAYRTLGNRLSSFQNFSAYVNEHREQFQIPQDAAIESVFAERLTVEGLSANQAGDLALAATYRYPQGEEGSQILNDYVAQTAEQVWRELRSRFNAFNSAQVEALRTDLAIQKEALRASREQQLFELEQAITTARRLGIDKPTTPQEFGRQQGSNDVIYAYLGGEGSLPLYFMGYETLEADKATLESVLDEGLSTEEIRETQRQLQQRLRTAELLDSGKLQGVDEGVEPRPVERVVNVVEYAFPVTEPVKPRPMLILAIAVVLGGMLGIVLVFLARFAGSLRNYRRR